MKTFPTTLPPNSGVQILTISPEQAAEINQAMKKFDRERRRREAQAARKAKEIYINR